MLDPIASIRPTSIDCYFDTLGVWLPLRTDISELKQRRLVGSVHPPPKRALPLRIDGCLCRYYKVHQPKPQAIDWLIQHGAHLTRADPALDWVFPNKPEKIKAARLLYQHFIVKSARDAGRDQDGYPYDGHGTFYSKRERYANKQLRSRNTVYYFDQESRITGELDCIHLERRTIGKKPLASIGIHRLPDLHVFDFRQFLQDNLFCYAIDSDRLGLAINNYRNGTRRRRLYRSDIERGRRIAARCTVAEIICKWRNKIDVSDCLNQLDISHLLPSHTLYLIHSNTFSPATLSESYVAQRLKPEMTPHLNVSTPLYNQVSSTEPWRHLPNETTGNHFASYPVILLHQDCFLPNSDTLIVYRVDNQLLSRNWSLKKMMQFLNHSEGSKRVA